MKESLLIILLLQKEKPGLVAIVTESGKHAQIALDSMDYGCNLIIEKPIALSMEDKKYVKRLKRSTLGAGWWHPDESVHSLSLKMVHMGLWKGQPMYILKIRRKLFTCSEKKEQTIC